MCVCFNGSEEIDCDYLHYLSCTGARTPGSVAPVTGAAHRSAIWGARRSGRSAGTYGKQWPGRKLEEWKVEGRKGEID